MSIYHVVYGSTADTYGGSTNTTYSTARADTSSTAANAAGTTLQLRNDFSSPNYLCSQAFFVVDTSAIPAGSGTGYLSINSDTPTLTNADTVRLREVSSVANKIAGASLSALTLLSDPGTHFTLGRNQLALNVTTLPRSATLRMVLHSVGEENGTTPTGFNRCVINAAEAAGTTNDPFLSVLFGTPWSFVGVSTVVEAATTAITLTEPAGVADGDLLVACFASRSTATTAVTNTGWLPVNSQNNNNISATAGSAVASGTMLYQVRAGTPDLSFVVPAGISVIRGQIVAYRGNATTTPLDVSTAGTTGAVTAVSVTGLTTTQDDDLIVAMAAGGQEATWSGFSNVTTPLTASGATDTTTAPSTTAWTERAESVTTTGADTSLGIFDAVRTITGATGNLTVTASIASGHVVIAGAFKIAPAAVSVSVPVTGVEATGAVGTVTVTAILGDAWSSTDKSANITLSNGDKTATLSTSVLAGVRSLTSNMNGTPGKYYAEALMGTTVPGSIGIGPISDPVSNITSQFRVRTNDGHIIVAAVDVGSTVGAAMGANGVLAVAWDAGAERVWFRKDAGNWNNSGSADPATGVGGVDCSFAAASGHALWMVSSTAGNSATLRTELAEFTQAVPSGFTSWMGETPAGPVNVTVPVTGVEATGAVGAVTATAVGPVTDRQYMLGGPLGVTFVSETSDRSYALAGGYVAETIPTEEEEGVVTVSVTGVEAAGAIGSVTVATVASVSVPVTGVQATGAVDQVTAIGRTPVSTAVTGVQATGAVNAVTVAGKANIPLTGVAASGSAGSVTVTAGTGASVPVTGVSATGAVGSVTATGKAAATVTGVAATGSVGSVTVTAGTGVTVPVTGVAAAGSVDSVSVIGKANVPLTGVSAAGAVGGVSVTAGGSISTVVTGVQATGAVGSVVVTAAELAGLVGVWNGSAWVDKPAKVWTGAVWAQKPVKHWNGSAWI